jgi:transcriptional regulator with XRE-family HTH domain
MEWVSGSLLFMLAARCSLFDGYKRMASIRKELNLTQAELAEKIGIKQQVIASYEIGRRRIPISALVKLSQALYVKIEDLLPLEEKPKRRGPPPRLQQELERIQGLPHSKQKLVMDLLETIINQ